MPFGDGTDTGEHIWQTLGYRRTAMEPGTATVAWEATTAYCFPTASGAVVQGGLVTALLDAAMGGACWSMLDPGLAFLTADLRVEFLRPSHPGSLSATGIVLRRTRKVMFCTADLHDAAGTLLATSRCTQVVISSEGAGGRYGPPDTHPGGVGDAPLDGRG